MGASSPASLPLAVAVSSCRESWLFVNGLSAAAGMDSCGLYCAVMLLRPGECKVPTEELVLSTLALASRSEGGKVGGRVCVCICVDVGEAGRLRPAADRAVEVVDTGSRVTLLTEGNTQGRISREHRRHVSLTVPVASAAGGVSGSSHFAFFARQDRQAL